MINSKLASLESRIARLESSLKNKTASDDVVYQEVKKAVKSIYGKKYRITDIREGIRLDSESATVIIDFGFDYGLIRVSAEFEYDRGNIIYKKFVEPDEEDREFELKVKILVKGILEFLKSELHPHSHNP